MTLIVNKLMSEGKGSKIRQEFAGAQYSTVQDSAVQYGTVQYGIQGVQQNCSDLVICSFVDFYSCKLQKLGHF